MSIIETIKSRPWLTGGLVVGALILFLVLRGTGSAQSVSGDSGMSDADQMQGIMAGLQTRMAEINAGTMMNSENIAGTIELEKIRGTFSENIYAMQQAVDMAKLNAMTSVQVNQDTLSAQIQNNTIAAGLETTRINTNAQLQTTQTITNALIEQSRINAGVSAAAIANANKSKDCGFLGLWKC